MVRPLVNTIQNEERVTYFAKTDSRGRQTRFGIKAKDRTRHMYVIGKTGMGKSTLLENLAVQDLRNGEGLAFIDPHGKSAELLLDYIPEERIKDTIYFAPFDMEHPISLNVMEDVGYDKRHLAVNGLMAAFKKIWVDAWSARMEYILTNTLLALLEYPGATMLGVNRMYTDKTFRNKVVANVKDPLVRSFWEDEFTTFTDNYTREATPAIQNKVGQFTGNPLIRNIVGQSESTFDLRDVIDNKKILIINLSKGKVGEGNANLLGSMLITKIYLAALSRADASERELAALPNFYLYVDEFQSFANESFADILSEARKYKLNLTMAHQYIEQMSDEVRAAVFGNVGTMITFRVGAYDAEVLEKEFMPQFTAEDLVNLGFSQIYLRLMIDGVSSQPFSATTLPPIAPPENSSKTMAVEHSRKTYARDRLGVEEEIERLQVSPPKPRKSPEEKMEARYEKEARRTLRREQEGATSSAPALQPQRHYSSGNDIDRARAPRHEERESTQAIHENRYPQERTRVPVERSTPARDSRPLRDEHIHQPREPRRETIEQSVSKPFTNLRDYYEKAQARVEKPSESQEEKISTITQPLSSSREQEWPPRRDDRGVRPETRAELKDTLASILAKVNPDKEESIAHKDSEQKNPPEKRVNKEREQSEGVRTNTLRNEDTNTKQKPREVPEEILREMLMVDAKK